MRRFSATLILAALSLFAISSCSRNDAEEIAKLKKELEAAKAELAKVKEGGRGKAGTLDSVAVLPFSSENADPAEPRTREALEVILPDALSQKLVVKAAGSLKVIASQVVRDRKLPVQPAQQSGKDLQVAVVLSGKLRGDNRLAVQLIAVESGELLWADTYTWTGPAVYNISLEDQSFVVENVFAKLTSTTR